MEIIKFIKKTIKNHKEKKDKQKELNSIKQKAYYKEMKKQNEIMGTKQAKIEAEMREKAFRSNLEAKKQKKEVTYAKIQNEGKQIDYFGLNKAFLQEIKII